MALKINDNFSFTSPSPNFTRDNMTWSEMLTQTESILDKGHIVYCTSEGHIGTYIFIGGNSENGADRWNQFLDSSGDIIGGGGEAIEYTEGTAIDIENTTLSVKIEENGGLTTGTNGGLQIDSVEEEQLSQSLQTILNDIKQKFYAVTISATRNGNSLYFTDETLPTFIFEITVKNSNNQTVSYSDITAISCTSGQEGEFAASTSGKTAKFTPTVNPSSVGTTTFTFSASCNTSGGVMSASGANSSITISETPFYVGTVNKSYSNNLTSANKQECAAALLLNATRNHTSISPSTTGNVETSISDNNEVNDTLAILSKNRITKFKDYNTGFEADPSAFSEETVTIQNTSGNDTSYYLYVKNTLSTGTSNYTLTY